MAQNLLSTGIIDPNQWHLARVWLEVAALLRIAPRQIDHLDCWESQIWVKPLGGRSQFMSYRRLPLWIESGTAAIEACGDRQALEHLGEVLQGEMATHGAYYDAATVERWRATWKNRAEQLKIVALRQARQEERLKLMGDRQRAYKNWQEGWRQVLDYCGSFESLERLAPELDLQSQTFDEFHGSQAASQLWHQRWQELSQASA